MANEYDREQIEFIEALLNENKTWEQRWEELVKWRKKNRELLGVHCSVMPKKNGLAPSVEEVARDLVMVALASAKGDLIEVDISDVDL